MITSDHKYLYAVVESRDGNGSGGSSAYYRELNGTEWKYMNGGQAVALCSDLKADAVEFMKAYGKEVKMFVACTDKDGKNIDYSK